MAAPELAVDPLRGGGSFECLHGLKFEKNAAISESISYHCALEMKLHYIELNFKSYCHMGVGGQIWVKFGP